MKKTGTTPAVDEGIGGGEVLGVVEVKTYLVKYKDGHGEVSTKLAMVIPDGETYFFSKGSVDIRPAQRWLREGISKKARK
jgi:hypothetical protein